MIRYYCDKCGNEIVDVTKAYSVDINPFEVYEYHPYGNSITAVNRPQYLTSTGKRIYCEKCVEGFK